LLLRSQASPTKQIIKRQAGGDQFQAVSIGVQAEGADEGEHQVLFGFGGFPEDALF